MGRSEDVEQVLAHYPKPVLLEQNHAAQWAGAIGGSVWTVVFLALAVVGIGDVDPEFDRTRQILMGVIFSVAGLWIVQRSVRHLRKPNKLVLRSDRFELTGAGGDKSYAWADVDNFRVELYRFLRGNLQRVAFHVIAPTPNIGDDHLTDNYGLSYNALVDLMEQWRQRARADGLPARAN